MYFHPNKYNKLRDFLLEFDNIGIKFGDTQYGKLNTDNPIKTGFWSMNFNVAVTSVEFPNGKSFYFCETNEINDDWFYVYDFNVIPYLNKGCLGEKNVL